MVDFSVSRSERWTAVAVASVPVGVDVEDSGRPVAVASVPVGVDVEDSGRPVAAGELAPVLSETERRWLVGREDEDLLGLWVMKESVGKAMGIGIVDAEDFSVVTREADDVMEWRAVGERSGRRWSVTRVDAPGAVLAVAIAGDPRPVHVVGDAPWSLRARSPESHTCRDAPDRPARNVSA